MVSFILATYCALVGLVLAIIVVHQHIRGIQELLSVRNVVILGFIIFQCSSPAIALYTGDFGLQPVFDQEKAGIEYCLMMTVFLPIAFWSYRRGWFVKDIAHKFPTIRREPNDGGMLALAVMFTLLALALRFAVPDSELKKLTTQVGYGPAAIAVGLCAWIWAKRMMNIPMLLFMLVILGVNMANAMAGEFGRRGIVAVGSGLIWGVYYAKWIDLPVKKQFKRLALLAIPPILFVAMFTSVRDAREHDRTVADHMREILTGARLGEGLFRLGAGQTCGPISMWLIENFPEKEPHRHLMTIRYFLVFPIPRAWMETVGFSKPIPMAILFPDLAGMANVGSLNVGPGIIGHAACEGGWYALIIYAILAGLYIRLFDEYLLTNQQSAIIVLAVGAGTGQYLALPRGEVANFASVVYFIVAGSLIFALPMTKMLCDMGFARKDDPYMDDEYDDDHEYDQEAWDNEHAIAYADPGEYDQYEYDSEEEPRA